MKAPNDGFKNKKEQDNLKVKSIAKLDSGRTQELECAGLVTRGRVIYMT